MEVGLGLGFWMGGHSSGGSGLLDYYVNSNPAVGNDSNDGRTAATAWRTLSKLDAVKANNLRVGLARGSVWEEELAWSALLGVQIIAYGPTTDALPHVQCSGTALNANFSLTPTKTNTYQITWAHTVPSTNAWMQVWENGVALTYVTSAALVESTPGSFFASSATTPATVSVHATGSTSPITNGRTYEISKREHSIDLGLGGTLRGIWGSRNGHADGSLRATYLIECLATEGLKHHAWVHPGGYGVRSVAYKPLDPTNREGGTLFVSFENAGSTSPTVYEDCWMVGNGVTGFSGCHAHTSGGGPLHPLVRHVRPRGFKLTQFLTAADTTELRIEDAFAEQCGEGGSGGTLLTINNMTLIIDAVGGGGPGSLGRAFTGYGRVVARDVRVCLDMATSGALFFTAQAGDDIRSCTFYGRTNINTKTTIASTLAGTFTVRDCVMYNMTRPYNMTNALGMMDADMNVVYRQSGALITTVANVSSASWALHLTNDVPDDARTANLDPLFTGDPQLGDFTLNVASPAYTGGRTAGSTKTIARPDWAALMARWDAGFLGIDGT